MSIELPAPNDETLVHVKADDLGPVALKVLREEIKWMVADRITDPVTGETLDARTCFAVLDGDGKVLEVGEPAHEQVDDLLAAIRTETTGRYYAVGL